MTDLESFAMFLPLKTLSPAQTASPVKTSEDVARAVSIDFCHMVLKLIEIAPDTLSPQLPPIAQQLIEPWQRLVAVIGELRSLSGAETELSAFGGLPDLPQTPEAIIPYVLEEIYDVLDTLQAPAGNEHSAAIIEPSRLQDYFLLESLASWLLWGMASSAYEMMQLMEGITVKVFQPNQGWQTGVLRLAALLRFEPTDLEPEAGWLIDLATYHPPQVLLTPDMLLQSDDCQICQQPILDQELLQRLVQQLQTTSTLCPFLEGAKIMLLVPGKNWNSGLLYLQLGLEFITATDDEVADWVLSTDSLSSVTEVTVIATGSETVEMLPLSISRSVLRLTDANWQKQYLTTISKHLQEQTAHHDLRLLLPQFADLRVGDRDPIPLLIEQAWEASEVLNTSLTLSSRNFLHQAIDISDLLRRLLWCLSSSAFEIMQLIGGIQAELLQPENLWRTGTLRLLLSLNIQTPELDWHLDIATGQAPRPIATLTDDAVVRSTQCQWCHQPGLIAHLLYCINQQIDRSIPEIQLLCQGASADISMANQNWHSGVVRLDFDFEFVSFS